MMVLALALAACAEDGGGLGRVAEAATTTTDAQTARFSVATELEGTDDPMLAEAGSTQGEGVIDFEANRGQLTMQLPDMSGAMPDDAPADGEDPMADLPSELVTVFDADVVYTQVATEEGMRWLRIDVTEMAGGAQTGNQDPTAGLELLRGADDVEEVGEEEVRGDATTHYRATLDLERARDEAPEEQRAAMDQAIAQLGSNELPVEVWLDEEDRVRRMRYAIDLAQMEIDAAGDAALQGTITTTMEFWDFGVEVDVSPPPDEEVVTLEELQQQGMEGLEGMEGMEGMEGQPLPEDGDVPADPETDPEGDG